MQLHNTYNTPLLAFNCNSGYANAPQYVTRFTRTSPILLKYLLAHNMPGQYITLRQCRLHQYVVINCRKLNITRVGWSLLERSTYRIWSKSVDSKVIQSETYTDAAQESHNAIIPSAKRNDQKAVQPFNEGRGFRNITWRQMDSIYSYKTA
jgi:hypothetical protein